MLNKKQVWNLVKLFLKIILSAIAIGYVFSKLDLSAIGKAIFSANPWWLLVALMVYVASQLISAFRLGTLFGAIDLNIPYKSNVRLYWLGMFYNFFLPGGVGGDGYKVFFINKYYKTPVKSLLVTIFSDRLSGLTVILVYLLALIYYIEYSFAYQGFLFLLIPLVSAGFYLFLYVFGRRLTKVFWHQRERLGFR